MNDLNIKKLYKRIKQTLVSEKNKLPSNCYFLDEYNVLALKNLRGDSRHPYTRDGLTLWAYSSGYITLNEGNFFVIPQTLEGKEPYLAYFGGYKNKKGQYDYFSLTGASDTELGLDIEKYTVFTPTSAIYLRVYNKVIYALEVTLNQNKEAIASITIINTGRKEKEVYSSSFYNCLLTHGNYESEETKWFRRCTLNKDGAELYSVEDLSREIHLHNYGLIKRSHDGELKATSTRMLYVGDKNGQLSTSRCLKNGELLEEKPVSQFIDSASYGDIIKKTLKPGESLHANYRLSIAYNEEGILPKRDVIYSLEDNENDLISLRKEYDRDFAKNKNKLNLKFKGFENKPFEDELFNNFINKVMGQVDYCSKTKNSSLMMLGIRDIAQMLEAMVMWNPKYVREKIVYVLNTIGISGRSARQISFFNEQGEMLCDDREFIDQGQWLISLVHKYICYTNDISVLKEKCGYVSFIGPRHCKKVDKVDTVFEHLETIAKYLINNIASDTGCLRTLFGDWNDAIDGLGTSEDGSSEYGTGVSVMATFHLYKNLQEMIDICKIYKKDYSLYHQTKETLYENIMKHCIVSSNEERRIVHGWGDKKAYYVGSFKDVDGYSRHSSTSNSFYVISGLYERDPSLKETILNAFEKLDGKYGLKTFDVPFYKGKSEKVGRVVNLPVGTAENAATYIHAGIFALKALGLMNEGKRFYEAMLKLIPLTHEKISTSPFVMPNSYGYNPEIGVDGESMNDWYTGSSNTLLKAFVDSAIGFVPQIDNTIKLNPIRFPVKEINMDITCKGRRIHIKYQNTNSQNISICLNDKPIENVIHLDEIKEKELFVEIIL